MSVDHQSTWILGLQGWVVARKGVRLDGPTLVLSVDHAPSHGYRCSRCGESVLFAYDLLIAIHEKAAAVTPDRDSKLQELKRLIQNKIDDPLNDGNRKVIVFTAFSDTAAYLYRHLKDWIREDLNLHCALVSGTGDNRTTFSPSGFQHQTDFISILTNFSPRSKLHDRMPNMPQAGEIDILIATDCISEGQNLQDCD